MACDLGNDSPFGDPMVDDSWTKIGTSPDSHGLEAISDFNAAFDVQNSGNSIDPQLTYSNPSTPQPSINHDFDFNTNGDATGLNQTLSPDPVTYEPYPSSYQNDLSSSPYYASVKTNPISPPQFTPSLRNGHYNPGGRRSSSAPPGEPAMMFHRENHFLGTPMRQQKAVQLKSQPKNKTQRSHPYANVAGARKSTRAHPHPHPHPHAMQQPPPPGYHPNVHRSQTQPVRGYPPPPPTSAPMHMNIPPYQFPTQHPHPFQHPQAHMMQDQHFNPISTTRICSPAAPDAPMMSPPAIDPALSLPSTPIRMEKRQTVNIPVTIDELRGMIFEAVQKAVDGKERVVEGGEGGGAKQVEIEDVEDEDAGVRKVDE